MRTQPHGPILDYGVILPQYLPRPPLAGGHLTGRYVGGFFPGEGVSRRAPHGLSREGRLNPVHRQDPTRGIHLYDLGRRRSKEV